MTQPDPHAADRSEHRTHSVDRRTFVKVSGVTATFGIAGCVGYGDETESSETPVIGSNHPLTGPIAYSGERMDNAIKLAAKMKNEEGGIESMGGAEVEVVSEDNKGEQELGSEAASTLVDEGADVLTGCFSSPVTEDATRVAESEGVPFVISSAVDASILQETPLEYVYRPQPSSDRMAANHANMMTDVLEEHGINLDTAGVFYLENTYGQAMRDGLRDALPDNGIEIVEEAAINFGGTAETAVTKFRDADPDVLVATTYESQTVDLIQAMQDQDYMPPLMTGLANAAFADPDTLEEIGDVVNGALTTGYSVDLTSDHGQNVYERYQDEYGYAMSNNVGMAYGAAEVIIEAFEEAGTTDPETLNETLQDIEISDHILAMPTISFRNDGENENATANLKQIQEFEPRILRPEEYSTTDAQFPDGL